MTKIPSTKIILIANVNSTFVKKDEKAFLEKAMVLKMICAMPKNFAHFIIEQFKILVFMLKNVHRSQAVVCWFADYHSFFPAMMAKLFSKPFYLVLGGYDTTYLPELDYGVYSNRLRSYMVDYAIKNTTLNLPVSNFLAEELNKRYQNTIKVEVLPTGYTVDATGPFEKEKSVLTVAHVNTVKRLLIKGIDRFIALATAMPEISFTVIGVKEGLLKSYNLPDNLQCLEVLPKLEVNEYYKKAKVYCQFSIREGLPNAVFEAMSYACVVIGMNHSGIAEAMDDTGYLLDKWDVNDAINLVNLALEDRTKGSEGKTRVKKYFNEDFRKNRLFKILEL